MAQLHINTSPKATSPVPDGEMMHQWGLQWPMDANKGGIVLGRGVCAAGRGAATALAAGICWEDGWLASPSGGSALTALLVSPFWREWG
jgi:hypothetical protein